MAKVIKTRNSLVLISAKYKPYSGFDSIPINYILNVSTMPATIDKFLGKPLLHKHQISDLTVTVSGNVDISSVATVTTSSSAGDYTVLLVNATSGQITISLPLASTVTNKIYKIKKIDSSVNTVVIDANASETIDGDLTKEIAFQNTALQLVCNGISWYIV
jgi:hypothetical protein